MAWSRLKTRWRDLLATSVAARVDVHMAGYRKAYEGRGRAWITVDGLEVASFCDFRYENAWREASRQLNADRTFSSAGHAAIHEAGLRDRSDLLDALGFCIGHSVDDILNSPEPLVRALAMLDRRVGRRRLALIDPAVEHPLVAALYLLRASAEAKSKS